MGIEVFENFNLAANKRLRYGWTVADETARLNLKWVTDGLLVKQKDDGNWYECIVDAATNSSAPFTSVEDWKLFEGKPGDNAYLYIAYADDDQGTGFSTSDASKDYIAFLSTDEEIETPSAGDFAGLWYDRSGLEAPELQVQYSADGVNNWGSTPNAYIRVSTDGGDTWGDAYQIRGADGESGDRYKTTSTTSNDITGSGQLTFTVDTDLAWTPGQTTKIVQTSNASNYIEATVDSYNGTTGEFVVTATGSGGTGTGVTDWSINLAGVSGGDGKSVEINYSVDGSTNWHGTLNASQDKYIRFRLEGGSWSSGARFMGNDGATGKAGVITANDITLTEALVTTVQGGSYTPQNPYIASVATDNRSNKFSPSAISGDMAGRAIAYDGTNWYNQGRWLGFPGAAANISSVSATSVDSSQNASVVLGGTQQNRTFQFNIPRGVPGPEGDNNKVAVDGSATPDFLGTSGNNGVLRTGSNKLSYTDGGNFVTIDVVPGNILTSELNNDAGFITSAWLLAGTQSLTGHVTMQLDGNDLTLGSAVLNNIQVQSDGDVRVRATNTASIVASSDGTSGFEWRGTDLHFYFKYLPNNDNFIEYFTATNQLSIGPVNHRLIIGNNQVRFQSLTGPGVLEVDASGKVSVGTPNTQLSQEQVQDFAAPLLNHANHSLLTASYDDANNRIELTVDPDLSNYNNDAGFLTSLPAHNHDDRYYTKTQLQTSGQAQVHALNLTNIPVSEGVIGLPIYSVVIADENGELTNSLIDDVAYIPNNDTFLIRTTGVRLGNSQELEIMDETIRTNADRISITPTTGFSGLYFDVIGLPTAQPAESNRVWNDNGTLKIT